MLNFQLFFGRWWCHPCRCNSITWTIHHQSSTKEMPSSNLLPSACCMHVTLEAGEEEDEEDFQIVPLNDEHWDMEEIPDRHSCIHEHSLPHRLCPYPCPYSDYQASSYYITLDLSDISEFEDLMTTSSEEDFPALNDIGYWKKTMVRNEHLYSYEL